VGLFPIRRWSPGPRFLAEFILSVAEGLGITIVKIFVPRFLDQSSNPMPSFKAERTDVLASQPYLVRTGNISMASAGVCGSLIAQFSAVSSDLSLS
jgi:hypothetical protein